MIPVDPRETVIEGLESQWILPQNRLVDLGSMGDSRQNAYADL